MEKYGLLPFEGIYNLNQRLRKIDRRYCLFYNWKNGHFELFSRHGFSLQKELDFGSKIDGSCVKRAIMTRSENIAKIMQKIDENNTKLEENALFIQLDSTKQKVKELISYADKTSKDLSEEDVQKICE